MNIIDWDATDRRLLQMDEIAMSAPENKNSLLEFFVISWEVFHYQ